MIRLFVQQMPQLTYDVAPMDLGNLTSQYKIAQQRTKKLIVDKQISPARYLAAIFNTQFSIFFSLTKIKLCTTRFLNNFFQMQNLHSIGFILILNLLIFKRFVQR